MRLSEQSKEEIRNLIEKELRLVSNARKIRLDKDLLEELLFLKVKLGKNKCLKLPIWSGEFLEKLDLSEVSFEDVSYTILYDMYMGKIDSDIYSLVKDKINICNSMVCYSNTNANIDFRNSFEYKLYSKIFIHGFNFTGTDLSNNKIDEVFDIEQCFFEKTGLQIVTLFNKSSARSSNFTGIDLSFYEIDADSLIHNRAVFDKCCCIRYTGMNISGVSNKLGSLDEFLERFDDGKFDGCHVNGVLVKSSLEREEKKKQLNRQYEEETVKLKERIKEIIKPYKVI